MNFDMKPSDDFGPTLRIRITNPCAKCGVSTQYRADLYPHDVVPCFRCGTPSNFISKACGCGWTGFVGLWHGCPECNAPDGKLLQISAKAYRSGNLPIEECAKALMHASNNGITFQEAARRILEEKVIVKTISEEREETRG